MNYDIILAGDSWCFLWYDTYSLNPAPPLKHESGAFPFLEILFNGVGFSTLTIGKPGHDNIFCTKELQKTLKQNTTKYVVYFFTESVRGKNQHNRDRYDELYLAAIQNRDGFLKKLTDFNQEDALFLAQTFLQHTDPSTQCIILGGHEEFKDQFLQAIVEKYPEDAARFHLIANSIWLRLFELSEYQAVHKIPYDHTTHQFTELVDEHCAEDLIDYFLEIEPLKDRIKRETNLVTPDGGQHPNAIGQFIIFNDLLNYIYNLEDKV